MGLVDVYTPPCEHIPGQPAQEKQGTTGVVSLDERISRERETHISFEYVEERDVLICKARDERTADAVLLRGELASEQCLAPLAR